MRGKNGTSLSSIIIKMEFLRGAKMYKLVKLTVDKAKIDGADYNDYQLQVGALPVEQP